MPWQVAASDVAGEVDPVTGEWAYDLVVLIVQRQAGKTALVGSTASQRCLTSPDVGAWYTAQKREDARDNWMQVVKRIGRSALRKPVCKVRESNGSETVTFPNGSTYRVFAPVPDALHGKANIFVCVDEGWAFDEVRGDELTQAILPTFATVAGQMWVISAAGHAGSTWLAALRDAGRASVDAGVRSGICYIEYGIDDKTDPTDLAAVAAAHPANRYTLRPEAIPKAAKIMKPGEFARAYGNRWTGAPERVIPALLWANTEDTLTELPAPGGMALAFDVGLGGRDAAICIAWRDSAGRVHVELVDVREGTSWLVPRLRELVAKLRPRLLVYDRFGPAVDVGDAAIRARLSLRPITIDEYTVACPTMLNAIVEGQIGIRPHPALDAAAAAAVKRTVGERWVWGRRASSDSIAGLVAATLALWGWDHAPPPPVRFVVR